MDGVAGTATLAAMGISETTAASAVTTAASGYASEVELLARLIRPDEKKKIRVVLEYDPETGVMHGMRDVIQDEE